MGGRLDATNVVEPVVSVIADISLDHQKFLGNTVGEIAREKVGILRRGGVAVTLPQQPEANDVIGNTILDLDAVGVSAAQYVPPVSPNSGPYLVRNGGEKSSTAETGEVSNNFYRYPLQVMGKEILVETPLVGRHQLRNVALAIAAAEELGKKGFAGITPVSIAARSSRDALAGTISSNSGFRGVAGNGVRRGTQSGRSLGLALCPFGAVWRPAVDFCFWSDARQGNL